MPLDITLANRIQDYNLWLKGLEDRLRRANEKVAEDDRLGKTLVVYIK